MSEITLENVATVAVGYAFKSGEFVGTNEGVRLLRCDNIGHGALRWEGAKAWQPTDPEIVSKYSLEAGDVVVAMDRPWIASGLKRAVVRTSDLPSLLVQRVARLRAKPGTDQGFIRVLVESQAFTDHILSVQTGTTVPHVSGSQILSFPVSRVPALAEQRAIAGVLGALDDKIESSRRIALSCEQLLATTAALGSAGSLVPLGELAHSTRTPVDPQSLGERLVDHFSIPAFDAHRLPERCSASVIMSGKFLVARRSVLVSRLNPSTPRMWLADPDDRLAMCSTEFLVLEPKDGDRLAAVWLAVVSERFAEEAERRATGTSFSHQRIKPDDALSIEVPDTRLFDGDLLVEADAWLERALLARRESAAAAALRDALLPELLSGRLRVREVEEMVGSV